MCCCAHYAGSACTTAISRRPLAARSVSAIRLALAALARAPPAEFHRPYWLTTRDAHGQHTGILRAFRHAVGSPELPAEIETLLRAVRPTEWFGSKITGVDPASDFVWIDDAPLRVEIETLRAALACSTGF